MQIIQEFRPLPRHKTSFINAISPFVGAPHGTPSNPLSLGEKGEPDVFWLQKKFSVRMQSNLAGVSLSKPAR
jgi:hypothetical protein